MFNSNEIADTAKLARFKMSSTAQKRPASGTGCRSEGGTRYDVWFDEGSLACRTKDSCVPDNFLRGGRRIGFCGVECGAQDTADVGAQTDAQCFRYILNVLVHVSIKRWPGVCAQFHRLLHASLSCLTLASQPSLVRLAALCVRISFVQATNSRGRWGVWETRYGRIARWVEGGGTATGRLRSCWSRGRLLVRSNSEGDTQQRPSATPFGEFGRQ